ncbi:transporter substrate-binding domain-containing protein [Pseudoclavibacter sp. CFCC 13796]|uniref:substrate-binding periplasmic protein n=1 Tax=Pseudoclavibacter sp. CFCC 13796 TaxID=2615179 RepID=UPI0013016491|nr:transporter substrate-binding domain-containing protein [Pseudoclavibacter sp. CFCC 13796]KAB1660815.1 transporter substrate-binding domain-containing protein [Pseudoclavibacter sp. CFCC 13796]
MNKKLTTLTSGTAILALAGIALVGCSSDSGSSQNKDCTPAHSGLSTAADGKLTVGVTDTPPFSANAAGGAATGLDIDIAKKLAEMECLDVAYTQATYANSIPMISQQKTIDITTGAWYPTAERNKVVDFSGPMYTDSMSIVSKDGVSTVAGLESLDAVGTVDGYLWTEDLKSVLGDKLQTYPSSVELQQDLLNGRLGAAVDSYGVQVSEYKDQTDYTVKIAEPDNRVVASVEPAQTVFPISKENSGLKEALDADLKKMREDGSLAELVKSNGFDESIVVPAETDLKIIG